MGWSHGSELMDVIIEALNSTSLASEEKEQFYGIIIPAFHNLDADTLYESDWDPVFAKALKQIEGAEDEDDDLDESDEDDEYRGPKLD